MTKQPLILTLLMFMLSGCAAQIASSPEGLAPVTNSLYSEFKTTDDGASFYGPFVAATQAQQDSAHRRSAHYYLLALEADPSSKFVADRAFFQLLYGGRMERAAELAVDLAETKFEEDDDLVRLMYALEAYKRHDWAAVRERLQEEGSTGFGHIIYPLLRAWSYSGEQDLEAAKAALAPLRADSRLKSFAEEHTAYMLDYLNFNEAAEEEYIRLTNANPPVSLQPAIAYTYMQYQQGKKVEARKFLREQISRFNNHNFLLREGALIAKGGTPTQRVASPVGAAAMVFLRLATEFAQGKSNQAAVLYARIATYLAPHVSDTYFLLGNLLEQGGDSEAAAAAYNSVPLDSPMRQAADVRRIEVLRFGGRPDLAEELLRNRLRKRPKDKALLTGLADVLQLREAYAESIEFYDRALSASAAPREPDWRLHFARAISYESLGNWPEAEKDLKRALELSPDQPTVLNYLGYTWIDKGIHIQEAKGMIEKAAAARPDDGFITDSLGWVYYLSGDYERAVATLEKAVRLEPDDVTINDHLGDAYWRMNRRIEARFQWQHAIDSGAEGEELALLQKKMDQGLPEAS